MKVEKDNGMSPEQQYMPERKKEQTLDGLEMQDLQI